MSKKKNPTLKERMDMLELALSQLTQVVKMHHQVLEQAARDVQEAEDQRLKAAGLDTKQVRQSAKVEDEYGDFPPNCS